ncbi:MAG: glycosyltransferase family 4 protein [Chitinophagales bacterium]|nr:glycosyltransferase family 4 protein [Chitinophagales bacterium]
MKDGEVIAIFNNIKGFRRLGHEVTVLAINTLKHYYELDELPQEVKQLAAFHAVKWDTTIRPWAALRNLINGKSYHIERFESVAFTEKLKELLKAGKFDIIQCEGLYLSPYIETIKAHSKAPLVMRSHNVESEIWERMAANESSLLKKWYLKLQASRLKRYEVAQLNRYDAIVPITEDDKVKLQAMGANVPMHVSPAGIDMERFNDPYPDPQPNTLFFIGGLDWLPNQEGLRWFLEDVWPRLIEKHSALQFHIAGRNMPDWLKNYDAEKVSVYGEVPDALDYIARRSIMIVPLFSGSGMRIKIIEGMAMRKCIIATTIGAEGIVYQDGKNLLIANTANEFIGAINGLLENAQLVEHIGKNARQLIESQYDNGKFAQNLLQFYRDRFFS